MAQSSVQLIEKECFISASQEQLLNSIPGWEDGNAAADFTPDELHSPATDVQKARSISSSSTDSARNHYGDLESQEGVEWGSPDDSFNGAFESDRDESPRRKSFSTGLFEEQPPVEGQVLGRQVYEDAATSCAQAGDFEAPADLSTPDNCLSPREGEGGQKSAPKVQLRAATEASPERKVPILASPVSTGSISSSDRHTLHGDLATSSSPRHQNSKDPNRRQNKRLRPILDVVERPQVKAPSPSQQVAKRSSLFETLRGREKPLNNDPLEDPIQCLEGPRRASVSGSPQVSTSRVEETNVRENLRTYARWLLVGATRPHLGSIKTEAPEEAAEENAQDAPCRLEKLDICVDKSETIGSVFRRADKMAIIVCPLTEDVEGQGDSRNPSDRCVIKAEASSPTTRLREPASGAAETTVMIIDDALPRASPFVGRPEEQELSHLEAQLSLESRPAHRTQENRQAVLQSDAECSQQVIEAKQFPVADGAVTAVPHFSSTADCSFSFEACGVQDFSPDLFGQLGKDSSQSSQLTALAETAPRGGGETQITQQKVTPSAKGKQNQHAVTSHRGEPSEDHTPCPVFKRARLRISPKSVMDVVRQCSGDIACGQLDSSDLLSAALQSGVSLPLPFQRRFPFS